MFVTTKSWVVLTPGVQIPELDLEINSWLASFEGRIERMEIHDALNVRTQSDGDPDKLLPLVRTMVVHQKYLLP